VLICVVACYPLCKADRLDVSWLVISFSVAPGRCNHVTCDREPFVEHAVTLAAVRLTALPTACCLILPLQQGKFPYY
jgi:hypothetical protein